MSTVIVVAGGDPPHPDLVVPPHDLVVAADSGADHAVGLGLTVDVLVGDLDSVSPATLATVRACGAEIVRHPRDKDATDVELALAVAVARHPGALVLLGGHGGRLDHALATVGALAARAEVGREVGAWMGPAQVQVVADRTVVEGRIGELVSLVPVGPPVEGITTEGLRWPLVDARFALGSTWGISNEIVASPAAVSVTSGVVAVVRPHALTPGADAPDHVPG